MKHDHYPMVFPHISDNTKFAAILCAALLGSALLAGLDGKPSTPADMAQEKIQAPEAAENAG